MHSIIKAMVPFITTIAITLAASTAMADEVDHDLLNANGRAQYTHFLPGHETTVFTVVGTGHGDIDCYLYDENGNRVEQDTRTVDGCVVYIVPRWSGRFTFVITNNGDLATWYRYYID